jgi:putative nucleotidyltransferase with HDIG domain
MNRLGVERLTLAAGLADEEIHRLVEGLAGVGPLASSPHAVLGRVHLGEAAGDDGDAGPVVPKLGSEEVSEEVIDEVETSFLRFPTDRQGSVAQLDQMLWQLVEGIDQTTRSLLLLGPMKSFEQRLFAHSVNVALLTLAQARSLGIEGQALHDIGLAALLHDIGKMTLPRSLLHKGGEYTDHEWEVVKLHPELGAAQLCGQEGVPAVAVLVAYEHHLRWDGQPSYPVPTTPRTPNLASQMTAIADTYDAMVAARGLTGGVHGEAARGVWQERSETFLDPFLVGNFVLLLSGVEE